jgi:hypothetical protein
VPSKISKHVPFTFLKYNDDPTSRFVEYVTAFPRPGQGCFGHSELTEHINVVPTFKEDNFWASNYLERIPATELYAWTFCNRSVDKTYQLLKSLSTMNAWNQPKSKTPVRQEYLRNKQARKRQRIRDEKLRALKDSLDQALPSIKAIP